MKHAVVILLAVLATGCTAANRTALAISTASLLCDFGQTLHTVDDPHRTVYETNPIMGSTPSTTGVAAYFAGAIVINALAYAVTPERYRAILPTAVTAVQVKTIADNSEYVRGVCGIR